MQQISTAMITTMRVSTLFWIFVLSVILVAGQTGSRAREFRDHLFMQWKPSLVIALLYIASALLGGTGVFPLYSIAIFCQALVGLALAHEIPGFEPLPVTRAELYGKHIQSVLSLLSGIMIIILAALVVNGFLGSLLLQLFGEQTGNPEGVASFFPSSPWRSFFLTLGGAGLYEETLFRLLCVSFVWRITHRPWTAILISALLFGAYHLSPLDSAYLQYWERPLTVFSLSTTMGLLMGWAYQKYGYETVVLGHTLGNWISLLLSRAG